MQIITVKKNNTGLKLGGRIMFEVLPVEPARHETCAGNRKKIVIKY